MLAYHLRVTSTFEECNQIALFICSFSSVPFVSCWEVSKDGKGHSHTHISFDGSIDALRKRIKKKFPHLDGNKHYSLERVKTTPTLNIEYVCKGSSRGVYELILQRNCDHLNANFAYHDRHTPKFSDLFSDPLHPISEDVETSKKSVGSQSHRAFLPKVYNSLLPLKPSWENSPQDLALVFYYYNKMAATAMKPSDDFIIRRNVRGILDSLIHNTNLLSYKDYIADKFETIYGYKFDPTGQYVKEDTCEIEDF